MIITNLFQGITVLIFLLVSGRVFSLYSLVFIYSLLDQFYIPAQQSSIPWLVPRGLLTVANGIFFLTQQASFIAGFGLAGLLISTIGQTPTIVMASLFLFAASFSACFLPGDDHRIRVEKMDFSKFIDDFKLGLNFIKSHHLVKFPVILAVVFQVLITIVTITLPTYTQEVLGLNLNQASLYLILPAGISAFVFTFSLPRLLHHWRKKKVVELGILFASVSLLLLALLGVIGPAKNILAVITAILLGISFAAIITSSQTSIQEHTPTEFRGRIYSFMGLLMSLTTLIPLLLAATLSEIIGVAPMMGALSLIIFAGYLFIRFKGDHALANGFRI